MGEYIHVHACSIHLYVCGTYQLVAMVMMMMSVVLRSPVSSPVSSPVEFAITTSSV